MGVIQIPPALWDKIPYELQTKMIDLYALIEAYTTQYVPSNIVPVFVLLVILSVVYTVLEFLYIHFLQGTPKNLSKKYGSWALVTGATDGIGFAMSKEFAKKGMNVCIVGRSQEKIDKCVTDLEQACPEVKIEYLKVDFSEIGNSDVRDGIASWIKGKNIGVLVNNVGVSYPYTKYYHELKEEEVQSLMTLNVDSTTWMTTMVLPSMIAQKKGAIINVASVAGILTSPLLAQYGAAKGYVSQMTKALHYEYASKGIYVTCHVPFYVATKLAKLRDANLMVASPAQYARAAINALVNKRGIVVSPFWSHAVQLSAMQALPEWLAAKIADFAHQGIRKAGIAKDKRNAAGGKGENKKSK